LDGRAERRLRKADRHVDGEVGAATLEDRRSRDAGAHVEVAGGAAVLAGVALAWQPDPHPVGRAGRDLDAIGLRDALPAGAAAGGTRLRRHATLAVAARAGLRQREESRAVADDSAAAALRARLHPCAGACTAATAGAAFDLERDRHLFDAAVERFVERDRDLDFDIVADPRAAAAAAAAAPEDAAEEVVEVDAAEVGGVGARPRGRAWRIARGVVLGAPLRIRQRVVGCLHFLEARLGVHVAGVAVRVVLARELAVRALDLLRRGGRRDAEHR